jgi:hypothetical protein
LIETAFFGDNAMKENFSQRFEVFSIIIAPAIYTIRSTPLSYPIQIGI